jgi:molecular chaperone GrpE
LAKDLTAKDEKNRKMSKKKSEKIKSEEESSEMILDKEATEELEKEESIESPEEVEGEISEHKLEEKSKEEILEAEIQDYKDKYLRLYSEFENFRRRTNKEKLETIARANERLLEDILPVIDDFERASRVLEDSKDLKSHAEGVELVYNKLRSTLETKGVKKMEALGKKFEPELHEAITQIPVKDKKMKGKVVEVIEDGYFLHDKVLRFAKVVVGQEVK